MPSQSKSKSEATGSASPLSAFLNGPLGKYLKNTDLLFTFGLFGIVLLLVLPVHPAVMDILLAVSIGLSLLVLLTVIYIEEPPSFSVFPTILLAITLFRLGLNVASTRLILLEGFAGNVIDSFGSFVVQGNYVVGAVVFLILVTINFIVITKGAGRIAEVAARFTLDALPGKQMSIDAELNAGIITEREATERRQKIQKEADFYGSMDGASKFVRGDAVAGILITLINVVGGITIGVMQMGLGVNEALQKYTLLSIGDGLVSQIPSLIVSVGAGILITRNSEKEEMSRGLTHQLIQHPRALVVVAAMLYIFAITPGMPFVPFFLLGSLAGILAWAIIRKRREDAEANKFDFDKLSGAKGGSGQTEDGSEPGEDLNARHAEAVKARGETFEKAIQTDVLAVELGYGLLSLADRKSGGDLLERITGSRTSFAREMGMIVPAIAVRDNVDLESGAYRFVLRGREVAKGEIVPNRYLAMNVSNSSHEIKGIPTVEPVFGLDAVWVTEDQRREAEINGYTVVDAPSVLITHLSDTLKSNAALILEREDTQKLIDIIKEKNATLINELLPDLASVGLIQRVLQNLLGEGVPIKNLTLILETIADFAPYTKNPDDLSEQARRRLALYFVTEYESDPGVIRAMTIDPRLESTMVSRVKRNQFEVGLMMDPQTTQHLLKGLEPRFTQMTGEGLTPVIMTTTELRLPLKRFLEPNFPRLVVLAYQEVPAQVTVQNHGILSAPLPNNEANEGANQAAPAA